MLGEPEICQFKVTVSINQKIFWLANLVRNQFQILKIAGAAKTA